PPRRWFHRAARRARVRPASCPPRDTPRDSEEADQRCTTPSTSPTRPRDRARRATRGPRRGASRRDRAAAPTVRSPPLSPYVADIQPLSRPETHASPRVPRRSTRGGADAAAVRSPRRRRSARTGDDGAVARARDLRAERQLEDLQDSVGRLALERGRHSAL